MTTKRATLEKSIADLESKRAGILEGQEALTTEREGLTLSRVADWKRFGQIALELGAVTPTVRALDAELAKVRGQLQQATADEEAQANADRWGVIEAEESQAFASLVMAYQAAMEAGQTLQSWQRERRKLNGHAGGHGWPFPTQGHKALERELAGWAATRPEAVGLPPKLTMREAALRQARYTLAVCQRRLAEGPATGPRGQEDPGAKPSREAIENFEAQWGPRVSEQKELLERLERMGIA